MLQIPVTSSGNSNYTITLDGDTYVFRYTYNSRNGRIYLDILKDGRVSISGLKVIERASMLAQYVISRVPEGVLFVSRNDKTATTATIGNTGINKPFTILYLDKIDVEA